MNNAKSREVCPRCGFPMIYIKGKLECPACSSKFYGVCNDKCLEDQ